MLEHTPPLQVQLLAVGLHSTLRYPYLKRDTDIVFGVPDIPELYQHTSPSLLSCQTIPELHRDAKQSIGCEEQVQQGPHTTNQEQEGRSYVSQANFDGGLWRWWHC